MAEQNQLKQALQTSGLMQKELANLLRVSRVMVHRYLRPHSRAVPVGNNKVRYDLVVKALNALVRAGKLPLPEDYDRAKRAKAVEKLKAFIDAVPQ